MRSHVTPLMLVLILSHLAIAQPADRSPQRLFPAASATNICPDTPLRLTFTSAVTLGKSGKIQIRDAGTGDAVETIDISSPTATQTIGGLTDFKYYPVTIDGNQATIHPRNGVLAYNKNYAITIDPGVFTVGGEPFAGIADEQTWRFATKPAGPKADAPLLVVAADGSGDFCTVQGALDSLPEGNTTPRTILLRKGTYNEIVCMINKHAITLIGEDRKQSIIEYSNNATFNPAGGNPFGGTAPNPAAEDSKTGAVYRRGLFLAHQCKDLVIANLTLRNTTPRGGSQAEAILLNGTTDARAILKDVDLFSFQDTLQINGQAYLSHCHIEGDVDFMWGTGPVFFDECTCKSVRSGSFFTQIRNPATNHGFVYYKCTLDCAEGVTRTFLSRVEPRRFPASEVVLIDCTLSPGISPVGWALQGAGETGNIHYWEFNSHDSDGKPIDVTQRFNISRQLTQPVDAQTIANYSDPTFVLGNGWRPRQSKIFITAGGP